jgi:hypothetical protein
MERRIGIERDPMAEVNPRIGDAGRGIKGGQESLTKVQSETQQLAIILKPVWPANRRQLQRIIRVQQFNGVWVVSVDRKLSNGE